MTNETEAPELFSPYHDGSMQLDTDGGWVSLDDCKDLSDAKDKCIAELEAKLAKAGEVLKTITDRAEYAYRFQDDAFNFGWIIKRARTTLAELKGTD